MMNWAAIAAFCSLFGVLATLTGIAFTTGRLTEKLKENREKIDTHASLLGEHSITLTEHEVALGRLNEWKDGYNAAARISGAAARVSGPEQLR
jgi:hypothetical protein